MATEYRESDLEWDEKDITPAEERKKKKKEEGLSDFAAGIIFIVGSVLACIGFFFVIWHSGTILGFVFKPWMEGTAVEELREDIRGCTRDLTTFTIRDTPTGSTTVSKRNGPPDHDQLLVCLENL